MKTALVCWQGPESRLWHPIGRLRHDEGYEFLYTNGAETARDEGFEPLMSFPELRKAYRSHEIFPVFANRIMGPERPEFPRYLERLALTREQANPMELLVRSTGSKATDNIQVVGMPACTDSGTYEIDFPIRSIRYMPPAVQEAVLRLVPGERLFLAMDVQNHNDLNAVAVRTEKICGKQETYLIGYCPNVYAPDIATLLALDAGAVQVNVLAVSPPPAPSQTRVMARLSAPWRDGFQPFKDARYRPILLDG